MVYGPEYFGHKSKKVPNTNTEYLGRKEKKSRHRHSYSSSSIAISDISAPILQPNQIVSQSLRSNAHAPNSMTSSSNSSNQHPINVSRTMKLVKNLNRKISVNPPPVAFTPAPPLTASSTTAITTATLSPLSSRSAHRNNNHVDHRKDTFDTQQQQYENGVYGGIDSRVTSSVYTLESISSRNSNSIENANVHNATPAYHAWPALDASEPTQSTTPTANNPSSVAHSSLRRRSSLLFSPPAMRDVWLDEEEKNSKKQPPSPNHDLHPTSSKGVLLSTLKRIGSTKKSGSPFSTHSSLHDNKSHSRTNSATSKIISLINNVIPTSPPANTSSFHSKKISNPTNFVHNIHLDAETLRKKENNITAAIARSSSSGKSFKVTNIPYRPNRPDDLVIPSVNESSNSVIYSPASPRSPRKSPRSPIRMISPPPSQSSAYNNANPGPGIRPEIHRILPVAPLFVGPPVVPKHESVHSHPELPRELGTPFQYQRRDQSIRQNVISMDGGKSVRYKSVVLPASPMKIGQNHSHSQPGDLMRVEVNAEHYYSHHSPLTNVIEEGTWI